MASACEVEYLLLLARDLRFVETTLYLPLSDLVIEVKKMLAALIVKLMADG